MWAPEIHYLKGTFWLTYSLPGLAGIPDSAGSGLLRSLSGKAGGPYVDVQPGERLGDAIDASLFQDEDGRVYFLWHSGKIARMNDDMSGLAEPYRWVRTSGTDPNPGTSLPALREDLRQGFLRPHRLRRCLSLQGQRLSTISPVLRSGTVATAALPRAPQDIYGPYTERYESAPHAGHNVFVQDESASWWSTYFGNDRNGAPWREKPGLAARPIRSVRTHPGHQLRLRSLCSVSR